MGFVIKKPDAPQDDKSIAPSTLCVVNGAARLWKTATSVDLYDHVAVLISGEGATSDAGVDFTVQQWIQQPDGTLPRVIKHAVPRNPLIPFFNLKLLHDHVILVVEIVPHRGDKARCAPVARKAVRTCEGGSPEKVSKKKKMAQPKLWKQILDDLAESVDVSVVGSLMDQAEAEYERNVNLEPGAIARSVKVMRAVMQGFAGNQFMYPIPFWFLFDTLLLSRARALPPLSRRRSVLRSQRQRGALRLLPQVFQDVHAGQPPEATGAHLLRAQYGGGDGARPVPPGLRQSEVFVDFDR